MAGFWHEDVHVEDDVHIGPYCVLGSDHGPLRIPRGSVIRSHSVIEGGVVLQGPIETGHHVLIRHGSRLGEGVRVGSYSSLEGGIDVGAYTNLAGRFQAGSQFERPEERTRIGEFVTCYSGVMMADRAMPPAGKIEPPVIGALAILGMGSFVMAGARVGSGAFVGAQAVVGTREWVPPGYVRRCAGTPLAEPIRAGCLWFEQPGVVEQVERERGPRAGELLRRIVQAYWFETQERRTVPLVSPSTADGVRL